MGPRSHSDIPTEQPAKMTFSEEQYHHALHRLEGCNC